MQYKLHYMVEHVIYFIVKIFTPYEINLIFSHKLSSCKFQINQLSITSCRENFPTLDTVEALFYIALTFVLQSISNVNKIMMKIMKMYVCNVCYVKIPRLLCLHQ